MLAAQQIPKVSKEGPKLSLDLTACGLKVSHLHLLTPEFIQCCDHKTARAACYQGRGQQGRSFRKIKKTSSLLIRWE